MKLPIALAVLAAVASTYASPMPERQVQVQTASVVSMTSEEFVTKYEHRCRKLLYGSESKWGQLKQQVKKIYRKIDDYDGVDKLVRQICEDMFKLTPIPASGPSVGAASSPFDRNNAATGSFNQQQFNSDSSTLVPWQGGLASSYSHGGSSSLSADHGQDDLQFLDTGSQRQQDDTGNLYASTDRSSLQSTP